MTAETAPPTTLETVSGWNCAPYEISPGVSAPRLSQAPSVVRRLPRFIRAKRSHRPPLVLQARDLELLLTAHDYRLITTPQYLTLFSNESRDGIYCRLQKLFHHGYLDRLRGDPTRPIIYALARRGAEVLTDLGHLEQARDSRKKNQELRDRHVAHQAMIVNFRIALTLAARDPGATDLLFFRGAGLALRDRATGGEGSGNHRHPINPDGFLGLRFPHLPDGRNRAFFFLEADQSTMTRQRFVEKAVAYVAWFAEGGHTRKHGIKAFRVLTVTKSEERLRNLLHAIAEAERVKPYDRLFWFTSERRFTPERPGTILGPVWETPDCRGVPRSLLA